MSTEAQIRANRANAQHSTGPRGETGKATSSQNHVIHRLSASMFVVMPYENRDEYDELFNGLLLKFTPQDSVERTLVETMAQSQWLVRRAIMLQASCLERDVPWCNNEKKLAVYLRYQTTHERAFDRALKHLLTLRAETRKQEIGFESQKRAAAAESRRAAAEKRKQHRHQSDMLLAQARADHQALRNLNLKIHHPLTSAASNRILEAEKVLKAA